MISNDSKKPTSIDEYIAGFPVEIQEKLNQIRDTIRNLVPEAEEAISYQMPTFKLKGNLVHFAAYQNHIGFYPAPSGIIAFADELKAYKCSKGAIQFPIDKPVPKELLSKIVEFRVKENLQKAESKVKSKKK